MKGFAHELNGQGLTNTWLTPRWLLDAIGPFDLDPCAAIESPNHVCEQSYTYLDDGLSKDWGRAFVFCNPPYGPHVGEWLSRMINHGNGIALVFARTETRAMQAALASASAILFVAGRIQFYRPNGTKGENAAAPSMLLAFGDEARRRLGASRVPGVYVAPQHYAASDDSLGLFGGAA